jgi:peptidyl-prolyl cis-trans isomerase SurA
MKPRWTVLLLSISFYSLMPGLGFAEVLDRIVARVNGHIILESDWEDELRFEALMNGRSLEQLSSADVDAALHHLVDQELLEEQMRSADFTRASDAEVNQRIAEVRKLYPEGQEEAGWSRILARYGITAEELQRHLALELDVSRLVEARLRPSVTIDADAIRNYYNHELLPRLRNSGAKEIPLEEASAGIREVLTEQRLNELLVAWLENLRSGSEIHTETRSLHSRDGSP